METRQPIQAIPGVLRATLDVSRAEYAAVLRKVRWGEGPLYVCAEGSCAGLGLAAGYAFASFVGRPVIAHPPTVFQTYALPLLAPRSVLLFLSAGEDRPEALELAHTVRQRGGVVAVLTTNAASALAQTADHVFRATAEAPPDSPAATVALHAALSNLAFESARIAKRPEPHWEALEREFAELPEKLDWLFVQFAPLLRSLAAEIVPAPWLRVVAGGFFHFPAVRMALQLRSRAGVPAEAVDAAEFGSSISGKVAGQDVLLFLSGAQSKVKKVVHAAAAQCHIKGARVLALTDSNDRELAARADLGVLVPPFLEPAASTLALFLAEWLAVEVRRAQQGKPVSK